jgi:hypothetical protein
MRYFVDAEFNGFGGELISLAAVPESSVRPHFYEAIGCQRPSLWVRTQLLPVLQIKPKSRGEVAHLFASYLESDPEPLIVSDCAESVAHAALLLTDHSGARLMPARVRFELLPASDFSAQAVSELPFNAYRDALALRTHILAQEAQSAARLKAARAAVAPRSPARRAASAPRRVSEPASAALAGAAVGA